MIEEPDNLLERRSGMCSEAADAAIEEPSSSLAESGSGTLNGGETIFGRSVRFGSIMELFSCG